MDYNDYMELRIICEVSRSHYHPGPNFNQFLTKKRDLSQPGYWVANEKIAHPETGKSYAIVMPPRDKELWEDNQEPHLHCSHETAKKFGIKNGEYYNGLFGQQKIKIQTKVGN